MKNYNFNIKDKEYFMSIMRDLATMVGLRILNIVKKIIITLAVIAIILFSLLALLFSFNRYNFSSS
jgi:hypothetical protein